MIQEPMEGRAHNSVDNPFVFVVGCPRSGTTLLRRLLNAHELISIPKAETHWIPKFYLKGEGLTGEGKVTQQLLNSLLEYHRFPKLGIDRSELQTILESHSDLSYSEFVTQLFELYGRKHNKQLVGDKTPGYVRFINVLHKLFPAAKFIHLVRDGRDVCLSMLAWDRLEKTAGRIGTFEQDPVTTTALYWEWLVRLGIESGAALPPGYYQQVSYELLVDRTEQACREMCEFLRVPFDPAMLEYYAGRERQGAGRSAKKAWLPPTRSLRNWRAQMPREEILRFEAASGDLLKSLGYECISEEIPPGAVAHANKLRGQFSREPHPLAWQSASFS